MPGILCLLSCPRNGDLADDNAPLGNIKEEEAEIFDLTAVDYDASVSVVDMEAVLRREEEKTKRRSRRKWIVSRSAQSRVCPQKTIGWSKKNSG
jgi:hypothetical protein